MRNIIFLYVLLISNSYAQSEPFVLENGLKGFYNPTDGTFTTCSGINGYLNGNDACIDFESTQWTLLLDQQINYVEASTCGVPNPVVEITPEMYSLVNLNEDERENGWVYIIWMDTSGFHTRVKNENGEWWENINDEAACFPSEMLPNLDNFITDLDNLIGNQELFTECMQLMSI